jgi:prepilin-type N-terminal cleavage/methylation domain-containing protein
MIIKLKGFTLVEMAVVLVIIGLMLGAVLGVGNAQIQQARISSTKTKQEAIKVALINYITRNNRLPCPAIATLAPGIAGYGLEAATPGTCTGATANGNVVIGIVPWSSLGVTDENATDGYYNRYTYQVALAATNTNLQTISGLKGAISIHTGTPVAMGPPIVGNQSNDCTPAGGNYNPCSAVAIIVSHGINGAGAYSIEGVQKALPAVGATDELENIDNDSRFVIKDYSDNAANPFDDIVLPLTASDLITPLTTHGSLKDYRATINDDFSNIKSAIIADAIKNRVGAISPYGYPIPAALPALPANTLNDPWGMPYIYAQNIVTPVVSGTAGNLPAFTLTSLGPDGVVGGNDDITTVITVNQLQDAFSKVGW